MRTKAFLLVLALVLAGSFAYGAGNASAQTATFPEGCSSGLGYSVTTGDPCNGMSSATIGPLPGCSTALGYSTVDGTPCSGTSVGISYLAGCTSIYGYSTITALPCNGTSVASVIGAFPVPVPVTPGFPVTGGGNALVNILYLGSSALVAALGIVFLARKNA